MKNRKYSPSSEYLNTFYIDNVSIKKLWTLLYQQNSFNLLFEFVFCLQGNAVSTQIIIIYHVKYFRLSLKVRR